MYGDMAKEEKDVGTGYKGSKYYKEHLNTRRNTRASLQGQTGDKRAKSLGRKVLKKKSDHLQKVEEVEGKEETAVKAITGVEHPWREHEEKEGDMEENGMEAIPEESEHQWREYEEVEKENDEGDAEEKGVEAIPEESEHPWREYEEVEKENDDGDAEEKGVEAIPEESEHPWKEHEEVEKENNEGDMEETAMKAVPVESEHPWREHEVEKENDEGDGEETGMESIPEESEHPWREHKGLENEDEGNVEEKGYEEEDGEDEDGEGARRKKEGPASSSHGRAHTVTSSKVSSRRTKGSTKSSRRNQTRHSKHTSPEDHVETHVSDLEFSVVPYGIPKQIPESDFANVDYYRLRHFSQPNSSQHSPLNTPSHSQPSSPQNHNYSSRGQHGYSFHEAIEEDTGEVIPSLAAVHATRGHSAESGHSVYDSGNASLFSDDDRPDSVFKAKNRHSRPITRAIEVNYDTDDGGVYRSKKRADYSRGALEILDSTDTKIELPVDMIEPVEIQEEVYAT
nr:sarcoplasmic reticulum histidine-rich calcium-binding protein-like [Cherax quadricarinatus]